MSTGLQSRIHRLPQPVRGYQGTHHLRRAEYTARTRSGCCGACFHRNPPVWIDKFYVAHGAAVPGHGTWCSNNWFRPKFVIGRPIGRSANGRSVPWGVGRFASISVFRPSRQLSSPAEVGLLDRKVELWNSSTSLGRRRWWQQGKR